MLFPKHFSTQGYIEEILKKFKDNYIDYLTKDAMKKTIAYIIDKVNSIIEQNKEGLFVLVVHNLLNIDQLTKEQYLEISKKISPVSAIGTLFWAAQISPAGVANVIQNNMKFSIEERSKEKYLEFLNKMTIQCTKELAMVNSPKQNTSKKVSFNDKFKIRECFLEKEIGDYRELEEIEKQQWLNRSKKSFKAYLKKEKQRDLQVLQKEDGSCKENINPFEPAIKKLKNSLIL